jgi:hypothetical protein
LRDEIVSTEQPGLTGSNESQEKAVVADRDAELEALRRAHEALSRRLIAERAAFADGIARIQANVYGSRSWRYTAPLRRTIRLFSRLKP